MPEKCGATVGDDQGASLIEISAGMITVVAPLSNPPHLPPRAVALLVTLDAQARELRFDPKPNVTKLLAAFSTGQTLFLVSREAIIQVGGRALVDGGKAQFHLTSDLARIILALREADLGEGARLPYRQAKSIEFLCQSICAYDAGGLAPLSSAGQLSSSDTRRVLAARQIIHDRANEKLTLNIIGRHCGLSRSKLTRGFKELFDLTVAQELASRRLELARQMLLTTDLPISSVGLEAGYLNNASFARAFGRRYGSAPSMFRSGQLAA